MSNETLVKSDNRKEAKGKRAEFQKAKPAVEGKTTVIHVARTAKVVKGGKRFGFRALVVVGNGLGKVGDFAAKIRRLSPPEPYKGSGIKYQGEHITRKAGKTAAGGK